MNHTKNFEKSRYKDFPSLTYWVGFLILLGYFFHSPMLSASSTNLSAENSIQQSSKVVGVVKDIHGEVLVGVSVLVQGTRNATLTDTNGRFSLNSSPNAVLQFSYLGYENKKVQLKGEKELSVVMAENEKALNEVVVMGYSTQNLRDVSSSVSKIDMKALDANSTASITGLLAGQAPGLQTVIRSATPGASGGGIVIRGNTSLSSEDGLAGLSNPLYIIDGVPMSLQDLAGFDVSQIDFLSSLNPSDIQAIDILKDAAATAIYGSRGANGVIIITTKKGTSGKPRLSASITTGFTATPDKLKVYTGEAERQGKIDLYKQTLTNLFGNQAWIDVRNGLEVMGYLLPSALTDKYNPAFNNAYDFQDLFYKSGKKNNYDLSLEGGGENSSYRIGLGHYNEEGVLVGYGFSRTSLNASLINDVNKHIHNELSLRYTYLDKKGGLNDYMTAMPSSPTELPSSLFYRTPDELKRMSGELGDAYNKNNQHDLSMSEALRIKITKSLSWNNQASATMSFGSNDYFIPSTATSDNLSYGKSQSSVNATINANSVLNYVKNINDHSITALLGAEINTNTQQMSWISAENGSSDYLKVIQGYQKGNINAYTDIVKTNMLSYFGSFGYGFKDNRYKIEGVLRRDASSRFGINNKWATFPSVKVHWAFSKEPWMQGCSDWLDFGKFRVSFGTSGSIAGDPLLQYNSLVSTNNVGAGISSIYSNKMDVKTYGGKVALVSDFDKVSNKSLSWSKSKEIDYGIDLELFDRRVLVTGDIYSKYISGLVYKSNLPAYVGYNSIESNLVDMINNGFELGLTTYLFPRSSAFQWECTLNLSNNHSTIAKLGNGGRDYINGNYAFVVGRPAFQYYTYEYVGALDSYDDLPVNPLTGKALAYYLADAGLGMGLQGRIFPGMPLFTDVNGDYLIDGDDYGNDKKIIDNKSPEPKIMGGFNTTLRYKNFSLRAQSSFAFGNYIFNTTLRDQLTAFDRQGDFMTSALYVLDKKKFWREPGDGSYYPMIYVEYTSGGSARAFRSSSMYLEKGDYWSIDNITLSYNLPEKVLSSLNFHRVNLYVTFNNVYMWKVSGVSDPRLISKTGYYNGNGYPLSLGTLFGVQFQF